MTFVDMHVQQIITSDQEKKNNIKSKKDDRNVLPSSTNVSCLMPTPTSCVFGEQDLIRTLYKQEKNWNLNI